MIDQNVEPQVQMSTKFYGIADCVVSALNPQGDNLEKLNVNHEKIAPYIPEDGKYVMVTAWLSRPEETLLLKRSFFLNREPKESNSPGKFLWIDDAGNGAGVWLTEEEVQNKDFSYAFTDSKTNQEKRILNFDKTTARKALGDEVELCQFIKSWLHLEKTQKVVLDIDKFFEGDFSELHGLFQRPAGKNRVIVGVGIEEGNNNHYQVYKKAFGRAGKNNDWSINNLAKIIQKDTYTTDRVNFGEFPYVWQEYKTTTAEEETPQNAVASGDSNPFV